LITIQAISASSSAMAVKTISGVGLTIVGAEETLAACPVRSGRSNEGAGGGSPLLFLSSPAPPAICLLSRPPLAGLPPFSSPAAWASFSF